MARSLPAGISALIGAKSLQFVWLVEIAFSSGTRYYSSGRAVTYGGHTYSPRVQSISGLDAQFIDRKSRDFSDLSIEFDNLADDGSNNFHFTTLDASEDLADRLLKVHLYEVTAATAVDSLYIGYTKKPEFTSDQKTCKISATFLFSYLKLAAPKQRFAHRCQWAFINETPSGAQSVGCPYTTYGTPGFTSCDKRASSCSARGMTRFFSGWTEVGFDSGEGKGDLRQMAVPLVWGAGGFKFWPVSYLSRVDGSHLYINFVVSGTQPGLPFNASDITNIRLFDSVSAEAIDFKVGGYPEALPTNYTRFPDQVAHSLVAHGWASFPITNQIKDQLGSISSDAIKISMANGRPTAYTGLPTENLAYIIHDLLSDAIHSLGLPSGFFDASALSATASYVSTRYQGKVVIQEKAPLVDLAQALLRDFHGFITFNGGKLQIGCKRNDESAVATYGTGGGLTIIDNHVEAWHEGADDLINQATIDYRNHNNHPREIVLYDKLAQQRAGNGVEALVEEKWTSIGLYDDQQVAISGAILVREEQNANLKISFKVPLNDGLLPAPGDVIRVNNVNIPNNGSNYLFRVLTQRFSGPAADPDVEFTCQVYKQAVYADTADPFGTDPLRTTDDTTMQGRPPNVTPQSLTIVSIAQDTTGKLATVRAAWSYPVVDLAADAADNVYREYPIVEVALFFRYTDQAITEASEVRRVRYPTAQADFQIDYDKTRSIEVYFVAIGADHSRAPLGYSQDTSKASALSANLAANATTASVTDGTKFTAGDYVRCEFEFNKVLSVAGNTITFVNSGGVRTTYFDSTSIAHPQGTQIAVARQTYPSLIKSLAVNTFTYPAVVATDVLPRGGDALIVRWTDISAENLEEYRVYECHDADANTNVNKLGSATPAWYLANPDSPPAGVTMKLASRQNKLRYEQEDIGPTGTVAYFRVAARNGKRNFSSALSNIVTNSVTAAGTTAPPADFPFAPNAAHLISNVPKMTPEGLKAECTFRVFPYTSTVKAFADNGVTSMVLVFTIAGGGKRREEFFVDDTVAAQTSMDVVVYFALGEQVTWIRTVARNAGGSKPATGSVTFFAGGSTTSLAGITSLAISAVNAIDKRHSEVVFGFTQPATPALVSHLLIKSLVPGGGSFKKRLKVPLLSELNNQTAGVKSFTETVQHPKNASVQWLITLVSVDGTTLDSAVFTRTTQDDDTAAPNNGTAISLTRAKLKHGRSLLVEFVLPSVQMDSFDHVSLIIHDNNQLGTGRRYFDPATASWSSTLVELSFAQGAIPNLDCAKSDLAAGGRTYINVKVGVWNRFNGSSVTYSLDSPTSAQVGYIALDATAGVEPASSDAAVPSGAAGAQLQKGNLSWTAHGRLEASNLLVAANFNTIREKYAVVKDAFGNYFDFTTNALATGATPAAKELNARLRIGNVPRFSFARTKLKHLLNAFAVNGQSSFNLFLDWYAENDIGISGVSITSDPLTITDQSDIFGSRDAVSLVDIGTLLDAPMQLLFNSDFLGSVNNGANADYLMGWGRVTSLSGLITNPSTNNINAIRVTSTTTIGWNRNSHTVSVYNNAWYMISVEADDQVSLNGMIPGHHINPSDIFSILVQLKAPAGGISGTLYVYMVGSDGTLLYNNRAAIDLTTQPLTTSFNPYGGRFDMSSTYQAGDKILVFDFTSITGISTTKPIEIARPVLVRGKSYKAHHPRPKLEVITIPSVATPTAPPFGDLGDPMQGKRGGGYETGSGGYILPG